MPYSDREVIVLCVRWYLRYKLSFHDLVEVMTERGLRLAHTAILRWAPLGPRVSSDESAYWIRLAAPGRVVDLNPPLRL